MKTGTRLKAEADMATRKNISLAPDIIRMGKKLAKERGMSFSGFLAELVRGAKARARPMQASVSADRPLVDAAFQQGLTELRARIKKGEDYSNSMFDQLRRHGESIGKLDYRVTALEKPGKEPDSLGEGGGIK